MAHRTQIAANQWDYFCLKETTKIYFWRTKKSPLFSCNGSYWSATCSFLCKSLIELKAKCLQSKWIKPSCHVSVLELWMLKCCMLMWMLYMRLIWIANCKWNVYLYTCSLCKLRVRCVIWIHGGMWFTGSHEFQITKLHFKSHFSTDFF